MADVKGKSAWDWIAIVLVIIGGLNLGILGLFNVDVIGKIFESVEVVARIIYVLIGLAALYMIYFATKE